MNDIQSQAANLLLDAASSFDSDAGFDPNAAAIRIVLDDLTRINAVPVALDDDDTATVDLSAVITPAAMAIFYLATRLGQERGTSLHEEIADLRPLMTATE